MKLYTTDKTVAVVFNDTREIWETAMRMLQLDDGYRVLFFGDRADDDSKELLERIHADGIETKPLARYDGREWNPEVSDES